MSYFGPSRGKPSFFNDPTFAGLDLSGLDPSGLQTAIDDNAMGPRQEKDGFGDSTLGKIIGLLGDGALGFVGQPAAYGASIDEARQRQQKMKEEDERRRRERMERREDMQWQWENEPEDPYIGKAERLARWYEDNDQAATTATNRARPRMGWTQNANVTRGEFRNEFGRPGRSSGRGRG
jgi:hypothetical protein